MSGALCPPLVAKIELTVSNVVDRSSLCRRYSITGKQAPTIALLTTRISLDPETASLAILTMRDSERYDTTASSSLLAVLRNPWPKKRKHTEAPPVGCKSRKHFPTLSEMLRHIGDHECHDPGKIRHLNELAEESSGLGHFIIPGIPVEEGGFVQKLHRASALS